MQVNAAIHEYVSDLTTTRTVNIELINVCSLFRPLVLTVYRSRSPGKGYVGTTRFDCIHHFRDTGTG